MNNAPTDAQFAATGWTKSSYSAADNECVEVAFARLWVGVRDSKAMQGPVLPVTAEAFTAFVNGVKGEELT
ncbi:DUF397 domain-containing protein [Streptomyces sp. NBC_01221]|uniref:DUF397 domain-containing protein n=1 Tax=unclassified Streptomyces TaxID=2593676 RepID=UPI00225801D2|nr:MULTISPECIES: DUF397 domain-containing protein [unclassified Streptomyces]MCX4787227.1 DUF397 domain-containing protein [Streptomyces sp. NBC_01221]MCX4796990.1 DUF397 domain-containing protein [Streptomyces sp. NBC_01242]WSP55534.1 DUF397 domain-containing protein [Streptomyces sp. NBC_01241]